MCENLCKGYLTSKNKERNERFDLLLSPQGSDVYYYADCLEEKILVTSNQTAFGLPLLWEYTTQMIVNKCSFEGLAASYNLTHNGSVSHDKGRIFLEAKRQRGLSLCLCLPSNIL